MLGSEQAIMSEHELEKLLGGFATDTLTPEEQQRLYAAALQDQQLFDVLADEQALKELLADPIVRRRLLDALNRPSPAGADGSASWLDWFRHPANLALAGGLAAATFAVVLGTKIYQDSLKQAAQHQADESAAQVAPPIGTPATPPPQPSSTAEPPRPVQMPEAPPKAVAKKEALPGRQTRQEEVPLPYMQEQNATDAVTHDGDQREQHRTQQEALVPMTELGKSKKSVRPSADQTPAAGSPQPTTDLSTAPLRTPAAGILAPVASARALFYGMAPATAEAERPREPMVAEAEQHAATGKMADVPLKDMNEAKRGKENSTLSGTLERSRQPATKPLGLRYSLKMAGPDNIDIEVDPATPVGMDANPRLSLETNQNGYLSVSDGTRSVDPSTTLFPLSGNGLVTGRSATVISLAPLFKDQATTEQVRLLIVFSRTPNHPAGGKPSAPRPVHLFMEQIDPTQAGSPAEHAVYVVNPDQSATASLSFEIPLSLRP